MKALSYDVSAEWYTVDAPFEPGWRHLSIIFSAIIFISVLLGLMDFSDIVMLRSRPNSCCQQNLKCFDMLLLSLGLFP